MKKKSKTTPSTLQMRMPAIIKDELFRQANKNGVSMSRWIQILVERESNRG